MAKGGITDAHSFRNLVLVAILVEFVIIYQWNKYYLTHGKYVYGIAQDHGREAPSVLGSSRSLDNSSNYGVGLDAKEPVPQEQQLEDSHIDPDYEPIEPPRLRDLPSKGIGGGRCVTQEERDTLPLEQRYEIYQDCIVAFTVVTMLLLFGGVGVIMLMDLWLIITYFILRCGLTMWNFIVLDWRTADWDQALAASALMETILCLTWVGICLVEAYQDCKRHRRLEAAKKSEREKAKEQKPKPKDDERSLSERPPAQRLDPHSKALRDRVEMMWSQDRQQQQQPQKQAHPRVSGPSIAPSGGPKGTPQASKKETEAMDDIPPSLWERLKETLECSTDNLDGFERDETRTIFVPVQPTKPLIQLAADE